MSTLTQVTEARLGLRAQGQGEMSMLPSWPSEAVNEVMGNMPYRPFEMSGCVSGGGVSGPNRAGTVIVVSGRPAVALPSLGQGRAEFVGLAEEEHLRPVVFEDAAVGREGEVTDVVDEQSAAGQGDRVPVPGEPGRGAAEVAGHGKVIGLGDVGGVGDRCAGLGVVEHVERVADRVDV